MNKTDLDEMSLSELNNLRKDVARAITHFESRRRKHAKAELEAKAKELGFSLSELLGKELEARRKPSQPKYQHPENPEIRWSGRGRKPKWFVELIGSGVNVDDLLIR
jgi:DNA-binding protein H-NS